MDGKLLESVRHILIIDIILKTPFGHSLESRTVEGERETGEDSCNHAFCGLDSWKL